MTARVRGLLLGLIAGIPACVGAQAPAGESTPPASVTPGATSSPALRPDLAKLPVAARQLPAFDRYTGRALAAGGSYVDPLTGVRVWKITDGATPRVNDGGSHDYAAGAVQLSRAWGTGSGAAAPAPDRHTILVNLNGDRHLVDLTRGRGIGNWRRAPQVNMDLAFTFSQDPATPRIAYIAQGTTLHRYNTATMRREDRGHFPAEFAAFTSSPLLWLHQDARDDWFVMMPHDQSKVIAWNSRTGRTLVRMMPGGDLDEPHLEKDGRYVAIITGGMPNLHVWDLEKDALVGTSRRRAVHVDGVRGYFHALDPDVTAGPQFYHHAATGSELATLSASRLSPDLQHRAAQWVQSDAELRGDLRKQWILWSGYLDGPVRLGPWRVHAGGTYVAPVTLIYEQSVPGVQSVRELAPNDSTRVTRQLTRAAALQAMTPGSFHYDGVSRRLFVALADGKSPAGRVDARAPGAVHDGVAFVRLDGSEVRLLAHHFSLGARVYFSTPRATISPDGALVLFDSNMGDSDGRGDLFAVEVPLQGR